MSYAVQGMLVGTIERGVLPGVPTGNLPHPPKVSVDIEELIRIRLIDLRTSRPDLFTDVTGIGVSTIGVVNRSTLLVESIPRKNWKKPHHRKHVINFRSLFQTDLENGERLFPKVDRLDQIVVHNDASARCLTECLYGSEKSREVGSLLYLMVEEGINGAVCYRGDLLQMERHSEMGHCLPQLHPTDITFGDESTGCPAHKTCFEGVASAARFRRQWGQEISHLPETHPAWDIEAYYLAQFVTIGVLTLNPQQIVLGGAMFTGAKGLQLIDRVRSQFLKWNAHYLPDYDDSTSVGQFIERARFGNGVKVLASLTVGCLAAFPEDREKTIEEKREEKYGTIIEFPSKGKN